MVAGQSVYIVSQFGILVALARLGTVENVGQFGLATAIVTPIYWLTDLGLRTNKNTDADDSLTFANLLALRLITSLAGFAMILGAAAFFAGDATTRTILVIYGAAKGVETLSDIAYGALERHGAMRLFAQSIIARGLGSLVAFTFILWRTGSVGAAFVAQLVVWTLVYALHDIRHARRLSAAEPKGRSWEAIRHAAIDSRHIGMGRFLAALANAVPRFVIGHFVGLAGLGLFTGISYVLQASMMMMTAVSRSITGHLADLHVRNHAGAVNRIVAKYTAATAVAGLVGTALGWVAGDPFVTLVFGPEFEGQRALVVLILLTATLRSVGLMLLAGPLARRSFGPLVRVRLADLAGIAAGSLIGASAAGLDGAAAGLAVAAVAQVLLLLLVFYGPARLRIG
jgi:O-antigen/teichoic acid export membrane protein